MKKIGIALSGGGVRSLAHLGVLYNIQWLGIPLSIISGSSMGAILGAVFASGISLDKAKGLLQKLSFFNVFSPVIPFYGFSDYKKIKKFFYKIGLPRTFEELSIPLIVTATDLNERKTIYFNNGDLWDALSASIAMPGFFYPIKMGDRLLVDGGISMNLPVSIIREISDYVIAVDCNTYSRTYKNPSNIYEVVYESLTFMVAQNAITEREKADFIVHIEFEGIGFLDFKKTEEIINRGYKETYDKIVKLRKILEEKGYVQDRGLGPLFISPLPEEL